MPRRRLLTGATIVAALLAGVGIALWVTLAEQVFAAADGPASTVGSFGRDFAAFRHASWQILNGQGSALYEFDAAAILAGEGRARFANPPYYTFLSLPFAWIDFLPGYVLWTGLGLAALAGGVRLLGVRVSAWTLAILLSVAGYLTAFYGQNSFFTFLLLSGSYASVRARRDIVGGGLLGLATYKPHLMAGFAVWLIVRFRTMWRVIVGAGLVVGALLVASLLVMPEAWPAFIESLFLTEAGLATTGSHLSLRHTVILLLPTHESAALLIWLLLAAFVVAGQVWLLGRTRRNLDIEFSVAVVASMLLAPRGLTYDWILLGIPLALLWKAIPEQRRTWLWIGLAIAASALVSVGATTWQRENFGHALQIAPVVLLASSVIGARAIAHTNLDGASETEPSS